MKAEHAAALKYIFQDEVYLLPGEKVVASQPSAQAVDTPAAPVPNEPVVERAVVIPKIETVVSQAPVIPIVEAAPVTTSESQPAVQIPATAFSYLGKNKQAFLIFAHYPDHDFIAPDHLTALQNILKRKEVELDDVAILNIAKTGDRKWAEIYKFFTPKKVLVLGVKATPPGLNLPPLNQLKQAPTASLLYSFSFEEMMSSNDNKRTFWEQMKSL